MRDNKFLAMGLATLGGALIVSMSAIIRHFSQELPTGQIMFWRSVTAVPPILIYMVLRGEFPHALGTKRPGRHLLRLSLGISAMACSFTALAYISVALVTAIGFLSPIMTLPLAALFLGDRLTGGRIAATILGFVGVALVLAHAIQLPDDGALFGVGLALCFAVLLTAIRLLVKDLARTECPATIAIYFALAGTVTGAVTAFWGWEPLALSDAGVLALAGLLGGLAHICGTEAVARAPLSVLVPLQYGELLWAGLIDLLIFATWPGPLGLAGMAVIVLAGLLVWAEPRRPSAP